MGVSGVWASAPGTPRRDPGCDLSDPALRVLRTAEHPAPFEGNTPQVLDPPIVEEINCLLSEACYAAGIAVVPNYGGVRPAAELEVLLLT